MKETRNIINKMKVDAIYEKKKHFNASDRKKKYYNFLGILIIIVSAVQGVILTTIQSNTGNLLIFTILPVISFIVVVLGSLQVFFDFLNKSIGHSNIARRFLTISKDCKILVASIDDKLVNDKDVVKKVNIIKSNLDGINIDAITFDTSNSDYKMAKNSILDGEEKYTKEELNS